MWFVARIVAEPSVSSLSADPLVERLGAYVPGWVRGRILAGQALADAGEFTPFQASVLMADISGFTAFAERARARADRGAEQVQEVLNACFGRVADLVEACGGDVLAFPGDAVLGLWSADGLTLREATAGAAACAAAIVREVDGSKGLDDFTLRLKVAVGAGTVWRSLVGGVDGQWQALVGGPALAQLEAALHRARPGEARASPSAAALLDLPANGPIPPSVPRPIEDLRCVHELPETAEALLRRLIPRTVQARIRAGQHDWLAEFRRVSVMFVRLTQLADPLTTPQHLQAVTRALQTAVFGYGGLVVQFVVDEKGPVLLAAWGVSHHAHEDDASRALSAGIAIEAALYELDARGAIGVATGRVWTGRRGGPTRSEFAMIGDVVNLAARLMQASESTTLCDEATVRECGAARRFEQMGSIPLKGRPAAIAFHPLEIERPEASPAPRGVPELFGRELELRLIGEVLDRLRRDGVGGVVVVTGDAGVGKSHLIGKMLERARAFGLETDVIRGSAVGLGGAYADAREALLSWTGTAPASEAARLDGLRALLGPVDLERLAPLLADALGLPYEDNELTSGLGPKGRAEATLRAIVQAYRTARQDQPAVLVLEDAHWLNSSVWSLAVELGRQVERLLIVIASRPVIDGTGSELRDAPGACHIELDLLDEQATSQLVCQRLGVDAVPAEVVRLVHDRSDGHPFFAEELAYALRDRGLVELKRRECVLAGDLGTLALPDTVEDVVTSRIDLLGPAEQLTLKVAGVIGRRFELSTLAHLHPLGTPAAELARQLSSMARLQLLVGSDTPGEFEFKHAITQQVAYALLAYAQRRHLHSAAAYALERADDADRRAPYELLAYHYRHAEDRERAMHYLERAGDRACADFANAEVVRFFGELLDFDAAAPSGGSADARLRRAVWHRKKGEAHSNLGQLDNSVPELCSALGALGRRPPSGNLRWGIRAAGQLSLQGLRAAVPLSWAKHRTAQRDFELARCHSLLGANFYVLDRAVPFIGALLSAAGAADSLGPTRERALAYADLGNVAGIIPLHAFARRCTRIALETATTLREPRILARVYTRTAIYLGCAGMWRVQELSEAMAIATRIGDNHLWEEAASVRLAHHYYRGELAQVATLAAELTERAAATGAVLHLLWGQLGSAMAALHAGDSAGAVAGARAALACLDSSGALDRDSAIRAHGTLAAGFYRQGHMGPAFASAARAVTLVERFGRAGYSFFPAAAAVADMYLHARESGVAEPASADGRDPLLVLLKLLAAFARRFPVAQARTAVLRGRLYLLQGNAAAAAREIERGRTAAERYSMQLDIGMACMERARIEGAQAERRQSLQRAVTLFRQVGAGDELARAERVRLDPGG